MPLEAIAQTVSTSTDSVAKEQVIETKKTPMTLEEYVRTYFADKPILAEIAKCESSFRHFLPSGEVVRGKVNKGDVGVMQINEYYHKETAAKLGYDLETLEGNISYAEWLYNKEGSAPWVSSSPCWKKYEKVYSQNLVALAPKVK
jgi:hypothetical protein